jgi:iron complex outermembrane receptor protein
MQPLADAPGAITIIDRVLIKASGAREVADLFRLVPGFQVGMSYTSRPAVAYHGIADEFSRQMQVLVDGRSIYSPYFLGSIDWNNLRLSLDDIDRIEVVRGSNSAAYGANAFMGVINIITRHPSQSQGAHLSTTLGNQGIDDQVLRYGGTLGNMHYRITAGRRSDNGFANFHDSRQTNYVAFRGDMSLTPQDELQIQLGSNRSSNGLGFAGSAGDPQRTPQESGHHLQAVWKRALGPDEEVTVNAYHMRDAGQEKYLVRAGPLVAPVDADRISQRSHLEFQHIFRLSPSARVVWGMEQRRESVASRFMFDTYRPQSASLSRLFGNLEWRLAPQWLLNAGALAEKHSFAGTNIAPRLMLNFQPLPGQTLRIGTTTAYRTPSLAEEKALVRYYVVAPPIVITTHQALGGLKPERVRSSELSYLGELSRGLTVDARAFHENVTRIIDQTGTPANFLNRWGALVRGFEYQLRWAPSPDTLVLFNQARMRIDSEDGRVADSAPRRSTTLFLSQKLPFGVQASLAHHWVGGFRWQGWSDPLPMQRRLDLRLGYPFRSGPVRGEIALVSQNVRHPYSEFRKDYVFEQRTFATLNLEF